MYELDLNGGGANLDLCPCQAKIDIDLSQIASIPGVDAGTTITGTMDYVDGSIPGTSFSLNVADFGASGEAFTMPGKGKLTCPLTDGVQMGLTVGDTIQVAPLPPPSTSPPPSVMC